MVGWGGKVVRVDLFPGERHLAQHGPTAERRDAALQVPVHLQAGGVVVPRSTAPEPDLPGTAPPGRAAPSAWRIPARPCRAPRTGPRRAAGYRTRRPFRPTPPPGTARPPTSRSRRCPPGSAGPRRRPRRSATPSGPIGRRPWRRGRAARPTAPSPGCPPGACSSGGGWGSGWTPPGGSRRPGA